MARKTRRRRKVRPGWPGGLFGWAVRAFFLFVVASLLWVLLYRLVPPPLTFTMVGDVVAGHGMTKDWMSLDRIDRDMVQAAIAAEDSKFCAHRGFDQDAIAEAMRRNAQGGKVLRGGSTISQQTAKNVFLWQGGGYFRKGLEAWFTLLIENIWGKRRIIEVYLNVAETGIGTYGVNAGAQRYFRHDASVLSTTEAARIAAILPLPKKRGAIAPKGFTRRYGNSIMARIGVVAGSGLDTCVYDGAAPSQPVQPRERMKRTPRPGSERPKPVPQPQPSQDEPPPILPGDEYEQPEGEPPALPEPENVSQEPSPLPDV